MCQKDATSNTILTCRRHHGSISSATFHIGRQEDEMRQQQEAGKKTDHRYPSLSFSPWGIYLLTL
ncbi:hypothetical protein NEUTE1DRAFT_117884 [Neurospora tetrasperma FGSC 2508]|uniref:Uncharacterized protein n=1 Tax=Neurospora tetrasperma (strain FGSC 2508 / ATCC MYA-4615 / P0657) TaxID=510951 RepID=F8MUP7_NEUT8|nr:uncharacterized protein NEUTE1DRAFT_117884 [Neurospora tetrasperma FGSC 2508]EGO55729.1 hypothetical protein NEUTE1DRAFT_117884 [Neurospora tetrasperma FGSC 2508]EGZ69019.1 hypothetical protein NEUTE2DRAFT_145408 [Neurospora tetrasperma FGSC 2509]